MQTEDQRFQDYVIVHELLHLRLSTHGAAPKPAKGAPAGFVQRINSARQQLRKQFIAAHGVRQWKKACRAAAQPLEA